MLRRAALGLLATLVMAGPALSQVVGPPVTMAPASFAGERVRLETPLGPIVIETDTRAPITSANFLRYAREGRFDGTAFYRGMVLSSQSGLIQGGARGAQSRVLPPIAHEPTSQTGLSHTDGAVSMARFTPGTATGDFFIIVGDVSGLDAGRSGDPDGFAVFGRVVEGMDVVRAILAAPKSATAGEGVMRGQMLEPEIALSRAQVLAPVQPSPGDSAPADQSGR
jgi:Peptidyl-prolyl cis-trans isomerase (rotamase) - cyclophilin family